MRLPRRSQLVAGIGALCVVIGSAQAQRADQTPSELEGVGVTEKLGATIPLDLSFVNEDGEPVRLGEYFGDGKPVILTLNYARCAMLCGLQLAGFVEGLSELSWTPGDQFRIVTVSIDPTEPPMVSKLKKKNYIERLGRPEAAQGWTFLTGKEEAIKELADAVGFTYRYDEEQQQYAHPAVLEVLTPDGVVARYLYGISYPPSQLKLALLEASEGEVGSHVDQLILYCFHYDPTTHRYAPVAMNIMRVGGVLTMLLLGGLIGLLVWRQRAKRRRLAPEQEEHPSTGTGDAQSADDDTGEA